MSRVAYVEGQYLPHRRAAVHIEDRGYQFSDGVYEVIAVEGGRLIDEESHLDRLERSLRELRIAPPLSRRSLTVVMREVVRRNRVSNGILYIQATRGTAPREHAFPAQNKTALVMTARQTNLHHERLAQDGVTVITIPDIRWRRCDIKSVSLLPNVLGKQAAQEAGAFEAWQIDRDGFITEGTSTNAWIVDRDGLLITRSTDTTILGGITRLSVLELVRCNGVEFVERPFTVDEAKTAREAFLTSTTSLVLPVVRIDDAVVGNGKPGSLTLKIRDLYLAHMAGAPAPHLE